jgi:hypothetical protein
MAVPYPSGRARTSMFAIKFLVHALRRGVALEFGNDAFGVLVVVATTEDRVRYRYGPRFGWDHFFNVLKVSRNRLGAIFKELSASGWLHYEPGNRLRGGRCWVLSPDGDNALNASPLGETELDREILTGVVEGDLQCASDTSNETSNSPNSAPVVPQTIRKSYRKRDSTRTANDTLSDPSPDPLPPTPIVVDDGEPNSDSAEPVEESLTAHQVLVTEWNTATGGRIRLDEEWWEEITTALRNDYFRDNWRQALEIICTTAFLRGEGPRKWKPEFAWFLKPKNLKKVIRGDYADRTPQETLAPTSTGIVPFQPSQAPRSGRRDGFTGAGIMAFLAKHQAAEAAKEAT